MPNEDRISVDELEKLLVVDCVHGRIWWRPRDTENPRNASWNARYAGQLAFQNTDSNGYLRSSIYGRNYRAAHVIWAVYYGSWPENQIDHIDGDRTHNAISNLREVSNQENCRNVKRRVDNSSGVTGVRFHTQNKNWRATIWHDGREVSLGSFSDKQSAIDARKAAEIKYGYHKNHGRAA